MTNSIMIYGLIFIALWAAIGWLTWSINKNVYRRRLRPAPSRMPRQPAQGAAATAAVIATLDSPSTSSDGGM